MRIAIVSTPFVRVPPRGYGGTELFCGALGEALVALGHRVTLFATGDSEFSGELRALYARATWPPATHSEMAHARWALHEVSRAGEPFDAVHVNSPYALRAAAELGLPVVYTLHHRREEELSRIYAAHPDVTYVAISRRQLDLETSLPKASVIHHGLDVALYPPSERPEGLVVHIGRFAPEKGTHLAIEAAARARVPVRVAGRCHEKECDRVYYERYVAPRLSTPGVEYVGEVDHAAKIGLLRSARALLCPILWEEPFGLIAVEGMLVGTPVIGFRRGSFPEIVDEGVTGVLVDDVGEMAQAIASLARFDRRACARRARERFSSSLMAAKYESLFAREGTSRGSSALHASRVRSVHI